VPVVDRLELRALVGFSVVREVMVAVGERAASDSERRNWSDAVEHHVIAGVESVSNASARGHT